MRRRGVEDEKAGCFVSCKIILAVIRGPLEKSCNYLVAPQSSVDRVGDRKVQIKFC